MWKFLKYQISASELLSCFKTCILTPFVLVTFTRNFTDRLLQIKRYKFLILKSNSWSSSASQKVRFLLWNQKYIYRFLMFVCSLVLQCRFSNFYKTRRSHWWNFNIFINLSSLFCNETRVCGAQNCPSGRKTMAKLWLNCLL